MAMDPEELKAYRREWYRERYQNDPKFREREAERKAKWMKDNEQRKKVMRDYMERKRREARQEKAAAESASGDAEPKMSDELKDLDASIQERLRKLRGE